MQAKTDFGDNRVRVAVAVGPDERAAVNDVFQSVSANCGSDDRSITNATPTPAFFFPQVGREKETQPAATLQHQVAMSGIDETVVSAVQADRSGRRPRSTPVG